MNKYMFSERDLDNAKVVFGTNWADPSDAQLDAFNMLIKETLAPAYLRGISVDRSKRPEF